MRKIAPLYALSLLTICFALLQSSQIDMELKHKLSDFNLRGKVKVIREETAPKGITKDSLDKIKGYWIVSEQKFSPAGDETFESGLARVLKTDTPFEIKHGVTLKYNKAGDTLTWQFHIWNQNYTKYYVFDGKERVICEIDSNYQLDTAKEKSKANSQAGNWIKTQDQNFVYKYIYKNDTTYKYEYRKDTIVSYSFSVCNRAGDIVHRDIYYANGFLQSTSDYSYDLNHNPVKQMDKINDLKLIVVNKWRYNKQGDVVRQDNDMTNPKTNHSYKLVNKYEYEYDDVGNWIEKEDFSNDTLVKTTWRQIEYYK